ncbi:MAG: CrcB family protein [Acidimicrobiia bacterium]|nr:CrcB family protein [Acidimicrobiia bacterium]
MLGAVAAGGAVGGLTRALIAEISASWPWPTLLVNVVGAFALGVAVVYGRRHWRPDLMAGVTVGLLGALTTFSTLAGELWTQQDAGDWAGLTWYVAASIVGGLGAAVAGLRLGRVVR